jgi:hypothetical protein
MKKKKSGIYHTSDLPIKRKESTVDSLKRRVIGIIKPFPRKKEDDDDVEIVSGEEYGDKKVKDLEKKLKKLQKERDPDRVKRMELGDLPIVRKKK